MTSSYEHWLLHKPIIQPATPTTSPSLNKRPCNELASSLASSSYTELSHTQVEYEQALSDLAEERALHAQIKAALEVETHLCIETELLSDCTQHWNETHFELIHSLKSKLIDSRTSHEDLRIEMRCNNSMVFIQDQWIQSWVHKLRKHIFSLGYELVPPPPPPLVVHLMLSFLMYWGKYPLFCNRFLMYIYIKFCFQKIL